MWNWGFMDDERDYGVGAGMLHSLGIRKMRLITNNPVKRAGSGRLWDEHCGDHPSGNPPNKHNQFYLETKRDKMGHFLNIAQYENPQNDGNYSSIRIVFMGTSRFRRRDPPASCSRT
jgi:hypothetical protein